MVRYTLNTPFFYSVYLLLTLLVNNEEQIQVWRGSRVSCIGWIVWNWHSELTEVKNWTEMSEVNPMSSVHINTKDLALYWQNLQTYRLTYSQVGCGSHLQICNTAKNHEETLSSVHNYFLFAAISHIETRLNEKICYEETEDSSVILPEKIQCRALNKAEPPGWYIPEENWRQYNGFQIKELEAELTLRDV